MKIKNLLILAALLAASGCASKGIVYQVVGTKIGESFEATNQTNIVVGKPIYFLQLKKEFGTNIYTYKATFHQFTNFGDYGVKVVLGKEEQKNLIK